MKETFLKLQMGTERMTSEIYSRSPLRYFNEIPVFSEEDEYTQNYETISEDHLIHFRETGENPWQEPEHVLKVEGAILELFNKYSKNGDWVLDAGIGMGSFFSKIKTYPLKFFGIDISYTYLNYVKALGEVELCYCRLEEIPYSKDIFDVIICADVLEHVLDVELCIEKILSVLKPGGYLIGRVPYNSGITVGGNYKYVHLRNMTVDILKNLFSKYSNIVWTEDSLNDPPWKELSFVLRKL